MWSAYAAGWKQVTGGLHWQTGDRLDGCRGRTHVVTCMTEHGVITNIVCNLIEVDPDGRFLHHASVLPPGDHLRFTELVQKTYREGDLPPGESQEFAILRQRDWRGRLPPPDRLLSLIAMIPLPVVSGRGVHHLLAAAGIDPAHWSGYFPAGFA